MVGPFGFVRFLPSPVIVRVLWPSAWFPSPCSYPVHQLVAWLPATALAPLSSSLPVHQQVAWLPATAMAPSTMSSDLDFLLLLRQMAPSTMTQILIVTADGTFRPCPCPCRVHQQVACLPATSLDPLSLSLGLSSSSLSGPSAGRLFTSNLIAHSVLVLGPVILCPCSVHQQVAWIPAPALAPSLSMPMVSGPSAASWIPAAALYPLCPCFCQPQCPHFPVLLVPRSSS